MKNIFASLYLLILCVAPCLPLAAQESAPLSLSLAEARAKALAYNEDLQKAEGGVRRAALDKRIAQAALLPQIDASANGIYVAPDMEMMGQTLQMRGAYMAGITLMQPLYAGGRLQAGKRLAGIGETAAREQRRKARAEVIAAADKAYWTCVSVQMKERVVRRYLDYVDSLAAEARLGVQAGMAVENDLQRISAKRAEMDYQLRKAQSGVKLCRLALCYELGLDPETPIVLTDTMPRAEAALNAASADVAHRPETALLRSQIEAKQQQVKLARGEMLPTVGLSVGYTAYGNIKTKGLASNGMGGYIPFTQKMSDNFALAMLSVNIPLCRWGATRSKVKQARIDADLARLDLQKGQRQLTLEAQQAQANLIDGRVLVETAHKSVEQNDESLRTTRLRYAAGLCLLTDVLDAQAAWQQAQTSLIEALTQLKIYETEYLRCTGRLD